ncbi:MAG: hypothetical protein KJZ69_00490 [Phycisphaerales bacterium]|nr:hypothetical protein [Phycisphaerales bacterium]
MPLRSDTLEAALRQAQPLAAVGGSLRDAALPLRMTETLERPSCLSIIISDAVYRDEITKKLIIVGTFNTIHAQRFPHRHDHMSVLFSLTSGRRTYDVALGIENGSTGAVITEIHGPMRLDNPLHITDVNVELRNLEFPEPGKHWVTLKVDGEIICQRPFIVAGPGATPETPPRQLGEQEPPSEPE